MPSSSIQPSNDSVKKDACPLFGSCKLPNNNHNYIIQFIYLFIAYLFLIKDIDDFTAINIVLFIAPIAIDLCFSRKCKGFPRILQIALYIVVIGVLIIGFSATFGFLEVTHTEFVVSKNAVLFSGWSLTKRLLAGILLIPLCTPAILAIGIPTVKDANAIQIISQNKQGESK